MPIKFSVPDKNTNDKKNMVSSSMSKTGQTGQSNKFATSMTSNTPITKSAQFTGSGANVIFTQPMFFSPLHTPQNWQTASKRREVYMWSFLSPCYITNYDDFSLTKIEDFEAFSSCMTSENNSFPDEVKLISGVEIQDGNGEKTKPTLFSKRKVNKYVNEIKVMGTLFPLYLTHDHNCMVIREEDIKCSKSPWNHKSCVANYISPTCEKYNCNKCKNVEYKISKVEASEVKKGDRVLIPFNTEICNGIIQTEDEARYAGHLASDGWVCDGKNKSHYFVSGVCANALEAEYVLGTVRRVFNKFGVNGYIKINKAGTLHLLRSSNKALFEFSSSLIKSKGANKKFTSEVVFLKPELQLHVLGAYIQSDGTYNSQNDNLEITTYSPHLANQLLMMFYRCGILARGNTQPISKAKTTFESDNGVRYILSIPSSECSKIKDYVPNKTINFSGKKGRDNKRFFWKNYVVTPVSSNKQSFVYDAYVYDIQCPPTFTITANSVNIYQCRFFFENECRIAAGIDFYSQFSIANSFKLECKDKKILKFYERLCKKIKLNHWLKLISFEYFLLGDVFPFVSFQCKICGNSGTDREGKPCNHPGGTIDNITVLNPDWIMVYDNPIATEKSYFLEPDDELRALVSTKQPFEAYRRLPQLVVDSVMTGKPIQLSSRCVSHIKHNASPYSSYGSPIMRRMFTILSYKTKLMTANWIVAERLILPIRVVKVGDKDRPASQDDISSVSNQLAAVVNDPNLTLVTHHAFDYSWYGACYSADTEILTENGWQFFQDLDREENVATYNQSNGFMEYQKPTEYHQYNYDSSLFGGMYRFKHKSSDVKVTPNHRMLVERGGKMMEVYSQNVKHDDKFISTVQWDGAIPDLLPYYDSPLSHLSLDEYLEFAGYYLSEGGAKEFVNNKSYNNSKRVWGCTITQNKISPSYMTMKKSVTKVYPNFYEYQDDRNKNTSCAMTINSCEIGRYLAEELGAHCANKKIPTWVKNLPTDKLKVIYDAMMSGDGWTKTSRFGTKRYGYATTSKQLADDMSEICLKLGYFVTISIETHKNKNRNTVYRLGWSSKRKSEKFNIRKQHILREEYTGKVYCVKVPNTWLVVRRNGRISIQGNTGKIHNVTAELEQIGKEILDGFMLSQELLSATASSYSGSQVGVEVMIKRLETWRSTLAEWVENNIFLPVATMQSFIDKEESAEAGETIYLKPTLKFEDLNLRDKTNYRQTLIQLHDKQLISTQTLLKEFDLDYDQETHRRRDEMAMASATGMVLGQQPGGAGGMGGMGGGMGGMPPMDMGGMGGGAPPGGMPPGGGAGGMPGMDGGMGGAPGGDMSGGMGGAAPAGGMGAAASANVPPHIRVTKKGKGGKPVNEQVPQVAPPKFIRLTSLEQKMLKILQGVSDKVPYKLFMQYAVKLPTEQQPFMLDFAYPSIGVCVESDGAAWHADLESKSRDIQRDQKLANVGWRILRFKEDAIDQVEDIKKVVLDNIVEATRERQARTKKAEETGQVIKTASTFFEGFDPAKLKVQRIDMDNGLGWIYLIGD